MTVEELELVAIKVENARKAATKRSQILEDFHVVIGALRRAMLEIERLKARVSTEPRP